MTNASYSVGANQSPPFEDLNLFVTDQALQEAVLREGGAGAVDDLVAFGAKCGSAEALEQGRTANEHPPRLRTHSRTGDRIDRVEYHPAYHACMAGSLAQGLHCAVWEHLGEGGAPQDGVQVARGAAFYMVSQMEAGHCCPVTMTHASIPVLLQNKDLAGLWLPKVLSRSYDPRFLNITDKTSALIGMGMTERQGGSDVRGNTTSAQSISGACDGEYILNGHKWFMSAPMSDAFFVLAQAAGGLSCFFVPRILPDGAVNGMHFQRLKEKLGNRSNASSEVEFHDAHGWLINDEGRGISTILEMVTQTRLDCALSSAGLMRFAVANTIHHARHRKAFGSLLIKHPLMLQVLADLALDVEAATALVFRLARAFDRRQEPRSAAWYRLMTPVTKYWITKIAPSLIYEAMECVGGNGYVEDFPFARLYREAPVNAIWEGSGNIMALDVLRVLQHDPDVVELVLDELLQGVGEERHLKTAYSELEKTLLDPRLLDVQARLLVERFATLAAATLLRANAPASVADAFIATRFGGAAKQTYGHGLANADVEAIVDRLLPQL